MRVNQFLRIGAAVILCIVLSASLARLALAASPMRGGHPRPCTPPGHQYGVAGIQPANPVAAHQYTCPPRRGR